MDFLRQALSKNLQTGFIDQLIHSSNEYLPQLVVNDKEAGKKVLTTIKRELSKCDEFWFSVAFVTTSGIAALINTLEELEKKGVPGKILVSQYLNFSQPDALKKLLRFKNIELRIATKGNFHSKGYLFKNGNLNQLIIGSSNLTGPALCENKEWNLKISAAPESYIIFNVVKEFQTEFENASKVDNKYIQTYESIYKKQFELNKLYKEQLDTNLETTIVPNDMQFEALANIEKLRAKGKSKALLISATGTGKTYLSAFDVHRFKPKRFLFIVHRLNIAVAAMKSYKLVFGDSVSMGIYSGNQREISKDYLFSTVQTISKDEHLHEFSQDHFDYIVIDETHRAGASSYQKILDYFKPKFLLGMTATPERTDGLDVFKLFDHTIAYEIRLNRALEENMLSPFHYFGISDITVEGEILEDKSDFKKLIANERIDHIIQKAEFYGCDNGEVRGLIFCSKIDECTELSDAFNKRGYKTMALSGSNSEADRTDAISRLESNSPTEKLDYIFTVDIFNEGIDIPCVNQVIFLRPTQSAIVFVQQLGRGLRKTDDKEYLTVIDFIGNYNNSYLIPIALFGDTTYNKDTLRKLMSSGSSIIPGASTINFDKISQDRIFESINSANMQVKRDLVNDYSLLKFRLGRIPMMVDFIEQGSRDPQLFVNYSKSYFNFVADQEKDLQGSIDSTSLKLLELLSNEINNSKRDLESIILLELLENGLIKFSQLQKIVSSKYVFDINHVTFDSCVRNLNLEFITENHNQKLVSAKEKYNLNILNFKDDTISVHEAFAKTINNKYFKEFLLDSTLYSIKTFDRLYHKSKFIEGFVLYRKYSRKDVFRILNWNQNPLAQNVGGYIISSDKTNCPIFVNYHKEEHISDSIKYEDGFINNAEFEWMSKSKRTLNSPDVKTIMNYKERLRLPLFIKKSNDEGTEFYYMGDVTPIDESFEQTTMKAAEGSSVSVVKVRFTLKNPVEESVYNYITDYK